jgi:hypothetical protein
MGGVEGYISPFAPVAAVWAPSGDKLFTPETYATATAMARLNEDFCFVDKFHKKIKALISSAF